MNNWYARFPIRLKNAIYFVAGNDLFKLEDEQTKPHLCLPCNGELFSLFPSENEEKIACISTEDGGPDIYIFDAITSTFERLTFFENKVKIIQFNSKSITFISNNAGAFRHDSIVYEYNFDSKQFCDKKLSQINSLDSDEKDSVFQKYGYGYSNWKGYKGGTAGQLWINEKRLITLDGNCLQPQIIGDRVYFLYDNGENGNVFSCTKQGDDLQQHTFHDKFQVQDLIKTNKKLLYTTGGEIGIFDTESKQDTILKLTGNMPHPDSRNFVPCPQKFMTAIDSDGIDLTVAVRGIVFKKGVFSGGLQKLTPDLRYRISGILNDKRIFAIKEPPTCKLVIFSNTNIENVSSEIKEITLPESKIGMAKPSPMKNFIAYSTHKHELHLVDYENGTVEIIFTAKYPLHTFDWSSNGEFLVYSAPLGLHQSQIRIYNTTTKTHHDLTDGSGYDCAPTFDPNGQFIAFISNRNTRCDYDPIKFDMNFLENNCIYAIPLQKDLNLLTPWKHIEKDENEKSDASTDSSAEKSTTTESDKSKTEEADDEKIVIIDFDNISKRIVVLPCERRNYQEIYAINDGKILLVSDNSGTEKKRMQPSELIETFCMKTLAQDLVFKGVSLVNLSYNKEHYIILDDEKFKILKAGEKGEETGYKKNSVFDPNDFRYSINQKQEWHQVMHEVWWLIREFFWSDKLSEIKWEKIWEKYEPYINNIRTREELDDLINEIQGEVGTSHAFILSSPTDDDLEPRGYLGFDTEYDNEEKKYRITQILPSNFSGNIINPILGANCDIKIGDFLLAIDKTKLDAHINTPEMMLQRKANTWITLEIESHIQKTTEDSENKEKIEKTIRSVDLMALSSDTMMRYRQWVEKNREYVHKISNNKAGYIHIPDMQKRGFQEFFTSYLKEYSKEVLIIDVRNNNGGNISSVILDQLQKKKLGLDIMRHGEITELPIESSNGSYILLVNAHTASDGEIFSHSFKLLNLGKIIGERTWGGVVGIMPRYHLIDGTLTSQPESATWFSDIQFSLENKGVIPDIEIINSHMAPCTPENDNQLNAAIEESLKFNIEKFEIIAQKSAHPIRSID